MTPAERRIRNDRRERLIRAYLDDHRPRVVLVPRRLARLGLQLALGVVACVGLVLAGSL